MKNYVLSYKNKQNLIAFCKEHEISTKSPSLLIQIYISHNDMSIIQSLLDALNSLLPNAIIIGATTDGEIANGEVRIQETIINFTLFEHTSLTYGAFDTFTDSYKNGQALAKALIVEDTQLLLVFSDGLLTNGELLLNGINDYDNSIKVAGGMAGDYSTFTKTFIFTKDKILSQGAVGVALNSKRLKVFNDYNYNWQKVGKELTITKCKENRVYEIDGKSAVEIYKEYLGDPVAERLPAIGIEFPLIHHRDGIDIARAALVKHDDGSLTFGGNMHEGEHVYFGYGNSDEIMKNAYSIPQNMKAFAPEAIFVYSCMSRRHFIGNGIEEELAPLQALAPMAGFFTYGEFFFHARNTLLNETLTVVGLKEEIVKEEITEKLNYVKKSSTYNSINALLHLVNKTSKEVMEQEVFTQTYSRFEQLFEYSGDGIVVLKNAKMIECNEKILSFFGYKKEKSTFLTQSLDALLISKDSFGVLNNVLKNMEASKSNNYLLEIKCLSSIGDIFWSEIMFTKVIIENEELLYAVFRDISQRKEMEITLKSQRDKLYYQAYHDDLTGLPNRKSIMEILVEEIENAKRKNQKLALLFLDVDGLKFVNDSFGHSMGDRLIKLMANRIGKSIASEHIVSRLGGDEFLILLKNVSDKVIVSQAEKILGSIREEIIFDMHHLYSTASIGISIFPKDTDDAQILLKYADSAMYEAKEKGRNQYQFYSKELTQKAHAQVKIAKDFRRGIRNKEFEIYYQPQIEIQTNCIVGVEALIRWNHPDDGFLTPIDFLDAIEKANLLDRLDKWVMNHAMKDVRHWYDEGLNPGKLALNISMSQLESDKWERRLMRIMSRLHFNPKWLELEVTETELMKHPEQVISRLNGLRDKEISIAIDDFGTGYSSLAKLKHLPFDKLKVDKIFVDDLPSCYDASVMFNTIITLAKNMKIPVLAEGVESKEQVDYLLAEGCEYVQGYYYYKPMSAAKLKELLREKSIKK